MNKVLNIVLTYIIMFDTMDVELRNESSYSHTSKRIKERQAMIGLHTVSTRLRLSFLPTFTTTQRINEQRGSNTEIHSYYTGY